ncbi:MAG: hypothetical protein ACO1OQ_01995 [Rufibacter sp.]
MSFKNCLYVLVLLLWGTVAQAQSKKETPEERKERLEKIDNAKIAFITEKLSLSQEQAQRFWPLYNELNNKKAQLRSKSKSFREENLNKMTDEQVRAGLESRLNHRQGELDLDKEYMDKYLRVISPKQLALLFRSEREFTKLLLERLQTAKR